MYHLLCNGLHNLDLSCNVLEHVIYVLCQPSNMYMHTCSLTQSYFYLFQGFNMNKAKLRDKLTDTPRAQSKETRHQVSNSSQKIEDNYFILPEQTASCPRVQADGQALSISRSGRCKARSRVRSRLLSDEIYLTDEFSDVTDASSGVPGKSTKAADYKHSQYHPITESKPQQRCGTQSELKTCSPQNANQIDTTFLPRCIKSGLLKPAVPSLMNKPDGASTSNSIGSGPQNKQDSAGHSTGNSKSEVPDQPNKHHGTGSTSSKADPYRNSKMMSTSRLASTNIESTAL